MSRYTAPSCRALTSSGQQRRGYAHCRAADRRRGAYDRDIGTERMLALPEEYAAYRSAYLTAGYHEDAASLDEVQITRNAIRGSFRMTSQFEARRPFELSAANVVLWALQLGVIYGCAQHDCSEARKLSLREISLKCLRPVTDPSADLGAVAPAVPPPRAGRDLLCRRHRCRRWRLRRPHRLHLPHLRGAGRARRVRIGCRRRTAPRCPRVCRIAPLRPAGALLQGRLPE